MQKNVNTPNFNMREYLLVKYNGFFPKDMPTRHQLYTLYGEVNRLPRRSPERRIKERQYNKLSNQYYRVMQEWMRQQ